MRKIYLLFFVSVFVFLLSSCASGDQNNNSKNMIKENDLGKKEEEYSLELIKSSKYADISMFKSDYSLNLEKNENFYVILMNIKNNSTKNFENISSVLISSNGNEYTPYQSKINIDTFGDFSQYIKLDGDNIIYGKSNQIALLSFVLPDFEFQNNNEFKVHINGFPIHSLLIDSSNVVESSSIATAFATKEDFEKYKSSFGFYYYVFLEQELMKQVFANPENQSKTINIAQIYLSEKPEDVRIKINNSKDATDKKIMFVESEDDLKKPDNIYQYDPELTKKLNPEIESLVSEYQDYLIYMRQMIEDLSDDGKLEVQYSQEELNNKRKSVNNIFKYFSQYK